jgi:hypothetical protein
MKAFTLKQAVSDMIAMAEATDSEALMTLATSVKPRPFSGEDGWYYTPLDLARNAEWARWARVNWTSDLVRLVREDRRLGGDPEVMYARRGRAWYGVPDRAIDDMLALEHWSRQRRV